MTKQIQAGVSGEDADTAVLVDRPERAVEYGTITEDMGRDVICLLGVPIDIVDMRDVVSKIASSALLRKPLFISTVNVNFLAISLRSRAFTRSLYASDLCTADGVAILALCRLLGIRLKGRVAGSDLLPAIAETGDLTLGRPLTCYFFGGTPEAGSRACATVNGLNPRNLQCLGNLAPGFGSAEELTSPATIFHLNAVEADFLIVSLGAEKGQGWIMNNRCQLTSPIVSHLGATINFLAGTVKRAPPHVQRLGLEWLWRIKEERHLVGRYAKDGALLLWLLVSRIVPLRIWLESSKRSHGKVPLKVGVETTSERSLTLELNGSLTREGLQPLRRAFQNACERGSDITLDLRNVTWADLWGMGTLLIMHKVAKGLGIGLQFINLSPRLRRGFELNGLGRILGKNGG